MTPYVAFHEGDNEPFKRQYDFHPNTFLLVVDFKDADSGFFLESPRSTLEKGTAFSLPPTDASSFSSLCSDEENDEDGDNERESFPDDPEKCRPTFSIDDGASDVSESPSNNSPSEGCGGGAKKRGIATLFNGFFNSWSSKRVASAPVLASSNSVTALTAPTANGAGGLILESRPANLPAKSRHEEARHVHLYRQMLDAAKRKGA